MSDLVNDFLICIAGKAASGKSTSLRGLENPEGVLYLCTESGKKLPFKSEFKELRITDPMEVHSIFEKLIADKTKYHTVVIDSITYLMDMYETQYVLTAPDSRKAWGNYQQFFKKLLQKYVPEAGRTTIITAHTADTINEDSIKETAIPIKGALKGNGLESYFSLIVGTKKLNLNSLKDYSNGLLNITDRERKLKYKHVLQTNITADTVHERLRAPLDLFSDEEAFIDGNIQSVINRLKQYYGVTK